MTRSVSLGSRNIRRRCGFSRGDSIDREGSQACARRSGTERVVIDVIETSPSRRGLLLGSAGGAALMALPARAAEAPAPEPAPSTAPVRLTVNGREVAQDIYTRTTLLDLLREHLHLTGTKKGCDHGSVEPAPFW
ncbi:MAG: hypothetical protein EBR82_03980 [Caulobacteraceae bacterium]|nr:hypothetical protein [Caulobacteraceae bacterium]